MKSQSLIVRRVKVDRIWLAGHAGRYEVWIGKRDLGTVERVGSRIWRTNSGHLTTTARRGAELLLNLRLAGRS